MSFEWPRDLFKDCKGVVVREGVPLTRLTTIGIGGNAALFVEPVTVEGSVEAVQAVHQAGLPLRVLGGGSNVLICAEQLPCVVLSLTRLTRVLRDETRLTAWAGASLPSLVRGAMDVGLEGLSGLVGVPGQVGGAVHMNAGGRYGWIWDRVHCVELLHRDGRRARLERADARPGYRDGGIGDAIVLEVTLDLESGDKKAIYERMRKILREKSSVQPLNKRSAGCIFKNPPEGDSAGRLIELAGLKGSAVGGARISDKHANFIINEGKACASDVLELIAWARNAVDEKFGVKLELEIDIWRDE